jgi:hypothetical protein
VVDFLGRENKMTTQTKYDPSQILSLLDQANETLRIVWENIPNEKEMHWVQSDFDRLHAIGIDLVVLMERCREEIKRVKE